ncbi:MAG TPA: MdtA/MuxA family multidrug efflux RND transporter periplasmic adaptor subunit [Rhizomicrobium sp.]|nr:MdtA/MuxA family multidrug efflux RND transporter periplasmic adaptor subunit [Rhizomicrobium sp.]
MNGEGTGTRYGHADVRARTTEQDEQRGWLAWLPRGTKKYFFVGLGVLATILIIIFLRDHQPTQTAGGRGGGGFGAASPVSVAKATRGDMAVTLNALGTVTPLATVTARPQVSGTIVKFDFQEGQMVKAGDVLAEIDPRPFQDALEQAKGTLDKDRAALNNAQIDLKRYQDLAAQNAISAQQVATQAALVKQDQGAVITDQGAVNSAALNVQYAKITSPVTGRVGIRQVDLGNLVQAGQTNGIVTVTQMQPMSVEFSLPEDNIDAVMDQMQSGAKLQAVAYDRNQSKQIATGTLSAVDSSIDPTTGTVKMRAQFDNSDNALFPNQFVNIRLLVNTLHDQTLVPSPAIQRGAQGAYVFVVSPDKTVHMRAVTTGATDGVKVAIVKGLAPGDTVVTDGADRLRDGDEVTIPKPAGNITNPSAAPAGSAVSTGPSRRGRFMAMIKKYCAADMEKYCPKAKPGTPDARQCFRDNLSNFSSDCQDQMAKMRSGFRRGGGFGGGG